MVPKSGRGQWSGTRFSPSRIRQVDKIQSKYLHSRLVTSVQEVRGRKQHTPYSAHILQIDGRQQGAGEMTRRSSRANHFLLDGPAKLVQMRFIIMSLAPALAAIASVCQSVRTLVQPDVRVNRADQVGIEDGRAS